MKTNIYTVVLGLLFSFSSSGQHLQPADKMYDGLAAIDKKWYSAASALVKEIEYDFYPCMNSGEFRVTNSANRVTFNINPAGYTVQPLKFGKNHASWLIEFTLLGIERTKKQIAFSSDFVIGKKQNTIRYSSSRSIIEYTNDVSGLRQNFIIRERPSGKGAFSVKMRWNSTLEASLRSTDQIVFHQANKPGDVQFRYEDLKVWDATGKQLPARMELDKMNNIISLVVEDDSAVYPVTIDPLNKTPEWTTSADGILPGLLINLQLQVQALYGYTVAALGDVNGDGYDDVAVGAPGMADVITGTGSIASVGAVFIYLGSSSGLPVTPSKVLQPNTAVAGALFGFSIDGGDITGDGKNDIVIGAPMDSYQTQAQGLFGDVNVTVTAGQVYLYRSEDLFSAPNPSPFLQLRLQGSGFFGTGVLGLLNNVSAKFLFGFSVAVTEDLNADNKKDIVIGVPNYLGAALLSAQSGAAFVYYSNNLSTVTPLQLNTPSPLLLGLPSLPLANTSGLLFGFSVDGMGDYNNDGYMDIVVGAPAGADLSSLGGIFTGQVLGGSAYVYYGNSTGINTSIGVRLQANPAGLLSNAANLFGYKVKGTRNAPGNRNGNILIGAPVASVLSNVLNGLQVKAGQVHVFVKKASSPASPVLSDQAISSPRATSILSILSGQTINVSLLHGASIDNMLDINCDGIGDIIVGEPLSTAVPLIGTDVVGGAAYIYLGQPNGTYVATPYWNLTTTVSPLLGVNATALLGFSVAGARYVKGFVQGPRALVGGPSNALDFGIGLLNLGNTLSTTYNFVFDNNGLGKAYLFSFGTCNAPLPVRLLEFNRQTKDKTVLLDWTTVDEEKLNHFELERSGNGSEFKTIALVFGNGAQRNTYQYTDKQPLKGLNYYRLRMVDQNGEIRYSQIVTAWINEGTGTYIVVAPNPVVNNEINIRMAGLKPNTYQLQLNSISGQLILTKTVIVNDYDHSETIVPQGRIAPGIYTLNILDKDKYVKTIKVLVSQ